jgi:hypothetical protein
MEFGDGTSTLDTNVYRDAADTLKTDDTLVVAGELAVDGALNHDGSTVGFYGVTPVTRQAVATRGDDTGGSTSGALANVSGTGADAAINNNFARLAATVNNLITALETTGLVS